MKKANKILSMTLILALLSVLMLIDQISISAEENWLWPIATSVSGSTTLTRGYWYNNSSDKHAGVDIAVGKGTQVMAAKSGTVWRTYTGCGNEKNQPCSSLTCGGSAWAGKSDGGYCGETYGNAVFIMHNDGTISIYGHLSAVLVTTGTAVSQGSVIGLSGTTGHSTGYHLHFQITTKTSYWSSNSINNNPKNSGFSIGNNKTDMTHATITYLTVNAVGGASTSPSDITPPTPTTSSNPDDYPAATNTSTTYYYKSPTYNDDYVKWIQAVLYQLGYGITVDGSFGPATRDAIIQFQSEEGLATDGRCGPATKQKLLDKWNEKKNAGYNPEGVVDDISGGMGSVYVRGWTFDRDNLAESLYLLVHIDDQYAGTVLANVSRNDVDSVYHVGQFHGYEANIQTDKTGSREVKIYALNIGGGDNVELGRKTVNITSTDTVSPTISNVVVSNVSDSGYTVTCTVEDSSGISSVAFPTWTAYNGQDDIIWHSGTLNGNTATCEIKTSEHNSEYELYITHIYAYDSLGNQRSVATSVTIPDSYVSSHYYNGHIYEVYDKQMTWSQAKSYCEGRGGYLLAIEDADEQAFINQILAGRSVYAYAIGGTDTENEGVWKWVNGKTITYTNWNDSQPDNAGNEDNMWIYADSSKDNFCKWNDYPGTDWNIGFICEIETANYTPTASVTIGGYVYELYNYSLTFEGAEEFCKSKGGQLASITSAEEQSAIYDMYKNSDCNDFCWIGAKRVSQFGDFEWNDGSSFSYSNWTEGEPNNYNNIENAVEIYKSSGLWNDVQSYACCDNLTRKSCFILKKEAKEGYYRYEIVDGKACIKECDKSISGDVIIPSTLGGYPVASIADKSFWDCCNITSIKIPESVTSIVGRAFYNCSGLERIDVEIGNTRYHSSNNCLIRTSQKRIELGCKNSIVPTDGSVTCIYNYAFSGCKGLKSITIPECVTIISEGVFYDCTELKEIRVLSKTTSIKKRSWSSFESIPETVKIICYEGSTADDYAKSNGNESEYINPYCDVTGDGYIDSNDLVLIVNSLIYGEKYNVAHDLNNDGNVNILDLIALKKQLARLV